MVAQRWIALFQVRQLAGRILWLLSQLRRATGRRTGRGPLLRGAIDTVCALHKPRQDGQRLGQGSSGQPHVQDYARQIALRHVLQRLPTGGRESYLPSGYRAIPGGLLDQL